MWKVLPKGTQLKYLWVAKLPRAVLTHTTTHALKIIYHLQCTGWQIFLKYEEYKGLYAVLDAFDNLISFLKWNMNSEGNRMCRTQFASKGVYLNSYKLKVLLPLTVCHDASTTKRFLRMTTAFEIFSLKSFHLTSCPERFLYFNNAHFWGII